MSEPSNIESELAAKLKWNAEADEYNQWDALGEDEKEELIIAEADTE